jgi:glutamine amidotransferase
MVCIGTYYKNTSTLHSRGCSESHRRTLLVSNFSKIKINLLQKISDKAHRNSFGTTDTQHCATLFFIHLGDDWKIEMSLETIKEARKATMKELLALIERIAHGREEELYGSSLNLAMTNRSQVICVRYSLMDNCDRPSLYDSMKAGPTLNRKYSDHPDGKVPKRLAKLAAIDHGRHAPSSPVNRIRIKEKIGFRFHRALPF